MWKSSSLPLLGGGSVLQTSSGVSWKVFLGKQDEAEIFLGGRVHFSLLRGSEIYCKFLLSITNSCHGRSGEFKSFTFFLILNISDVSFIPDAPAVWGAFVRVDSIGELRVDRRRRLVRVTLSCLFRVRKLRQPARVCACKSKGQQSSAILCVRAPPGSRHTSRRLCAAWTAHRYRQRRQ